MPRIVPAQSDGGGYPSAVTTRVHSSMTAETRETPAPDLAIAPARDLVNDVIVALQAKPKNFVHNMATMSSLTWTGMPPDSSAILMAAQRGDARPSNSPIAVMLNRTWLCWMVPSDVRAALMKVSPPSTRGAPNVSVRTSMCRMPFRRGNTTL